MAEEINNGRIVINDSFSPILVSAASIIQVPESSETNRIIVFVSKHGIVNSTWLKFTDNSLISIQPPFFVMCNRKNIVLPAMGS